MQLRWLRFNLHLLVPLSIPLLVVAVVWLDLPVTLAAVIAATLVLLLTDGIARPASSVFHPTITHGRRDSHKVALTFDDGPDPLVTPEVLDTLVAHNARATFFTIGQSVEAHPELARRIVNEGHVLGNHSWQHSRTQNFRYRWWHRAELARSEQILDNVAGGQRERLYRPPVGLKIGELCREIWRRRLTIVAWSLHSHDTRLASAEQIAKRVLSKVRGGDIILMHDGHDQPDQHRPHCAKAVALILQGLREKGLECVAIPDLLADVNDHARSRSSIRNKLHP